MGQEIIEKFHRWSITLGITGICGLIVLVILFRRFQYGKWWGERLKKAIAFWLACVLLALSAANLAVQAASLAQTARGAPGKVAVAVEGTSVRPNVYQDTAVAEFTFYEKNFDENGVCVTIGDETGRETRLTFEEGVWEGLAGLGEGVVEVVPYEILDAKSEDQGEAVTQERAQRWFLDSEEGLSEHTESRTVKMRLRFPAEGCYEIREALCRDLAGNLSGLPAPVSLTIDRTQPELQMELPEEKLAHEGYYSHPITVWLYLKEHNFRPKEAEGLPRIVLEKIQEGEAGKENKDEKGTSGTVYGEGTWERAAEKGNDWYKLPVTVTDEGRYRLNVFYEDPAGWPLSRESVSEREFTVDMTAPEFGCVTAMGESWNAFLEHVTFGHYSCHAELVTFEGHDSLSPVEPLRYFCSEGEMTGRELQDISQEEWEEGKSLLLTPDWKGVVYLKVTDYAGLSSYFNSEGLVVENKGPVIWLSPQGDAWTESGIYRGDVELTVLLKEPDETGVASGLKSASYMLEAERGEGRETLQEEILLEPPAQKGSEAGKSWQGRVLLEADKYDGETLWFTVFAEDMAGNKSEKSLRFSVDKTAPKLQVTYGKEQPEHGIYYNQERRVQLTVEEANFSEERIWLLITNTDGSLPVVSPWSHDGNLHSCQIVFSEDGDYTFSVKGEDLAGHVSEIKEKEFTIDRTPPRLTVEFTGEGNSRYYNVPKTARITVEEHNFSEEQVLNEVKADLDDGKTGSWQFGEFDNRGDIHMAAVDFSEDGDYYLRVSCRDLAGNRDGEGYEKEFSLDCTPPSIEILGLENESANRGTVEAKIRFLDNRLVPGSVTVGVSRLDQGERGSYQYQELPGDEGEVIKQLLPESFPEEEGVDGLYLLQAVGKDRAGNKAERTLTFSVNRYGSVYVAAGETEEWLGGEEYCYLLEERDVVIREYNVDPVENFQAALNRNGVVLLLEEGKTIQREKISPKERESKWQIYEYKIDKEMFEQEGDYEILLYSEDKAGNKMGNESVKKEERAAMFAFSVDKTGPSAVLSGAKDRGRYMRDRLELFLDIRDNMRLKKAEVRTREGRVCYEGESLEEIETEDGLRVVLPEWDDWQTLRLYAEDAAGNRLKLGNGREMRAGGWMEWEFLVTSDRWTQIYQNETALVVFLVLAVVLTAAAIFFTAKRKRIQGKERKKKI